MTTTHVSRRRVPYTLAALLVSLIVGCGKRQAPPEAGRDYDYGPVFAADDGLLVHTFKIANTSNKIFKIKKVTRSCNCAEAKLSEMTISPGSSADLRLSIKPSPALGNWRVVCTLETDDPEQPNWNYAVTYRTYPHVRFDTSSLDLGLSTRGGAGVDTPTNRAETWFEVCEQTSNRADAFGMAEAPPPLALKVNQAPVIDRLEKGKITRSRYRLDVRFDPKSSDSDDASGTHSATVSAKTRLGHATSNVNNINLCVLTGSNRRHWQR